jgi:hypothetical protein
MHLLYKCKCFFYKSVFFIKFFIPRRFADYGESQLTIRAIFSVKTDRRRMPIRKGPVCLQLGIGDGADNIPFFMASDPAAPKLRSRRNHPDATSGFSRWRCWPPRWPLITPRGSANRSGTSSMQKAFAKFLRPGKPRI